MTLEGPALRLSILVDEDDQFHHRPLYSEIVHRAHAAGLAGASVFHGIEGFGAASRIHTNRLLSLADDLPVLVLIVDAAAKVEAFLPQVTELVGGGLVMVEDVRVVRHG